MVLLGNYLEIQRIETYYEEPSEVLSSQRASQDFDPEEQFLENKDTNDLTYMMITNCEWDSTTLDDHLQIPEEETHNGEKYLSKDICSQELWQNCWPDPPQLS